MSRLFASSCAPALLVWALLAPGPARGDEQAAESPSPCDRLAPADLHRICSSGQLRVARYGGERPPFFTRQGGGIRSDTRVWVGFDVDLAHDIAKRLGVRYRMVPARSFNHVVDLVATGAADVGLSKLSITLDRAQRVRFSKPYMTVYQTLLVNRLSAPKQEDPFEFLNRAGARIGALAGSSYIGYAGHEFPSAQIAPYDDFDSMMDDVVGGRLDAAFVDSARANTWRQENPQLLIRVRAFIAHDRRDSLALAVNWADTHLLAWLNLYLDSIRDDGWADALYRKWFTSLRAAVKTGGGL